MTNENKNKWSVIINIALTTLTAILYLRADSFVRVKQHSELWCNRRVVGQGRVERGSFTLSPEDLRKEHRSQHFSSLTSLTSLTS